MSVIHAPKQNDLNAPMLVIPGVILVALTGFVARLWYLQIDQYEKYKESASRTYTIDDAVLPVRGEIVDRNGKTLADISPTYVVFARPDIVQAHMDVLDKLAQETGLDIDDLKKNFKRVSGNHRLLAPIAKDLTEQQAAIIAEAGSDLNGITVDLRPMRRYPDPTSFSHVLGYVGNRRDDKKEPGTDPPDIQGVAGLEKQYDSYLGGVNGKISYTSDQRRRPGRLLTSEDAVPGSKVVTTLDADLQKLVVQMMGKQRGSFVAMDVRTGDVLTMVSTPSFDLRARWSTDEDEGQLARMDMDDLADQTPELFRPLVSRKAPGSSFKIVTTLAAELSHRFNPAFTLTCPGYFAMSSTQKLRCENHAPGETLDFHRALEASCNTYFATMAKNIPTDELFSAYKTLGLETPTGIDIPEPPHGLRLDAEMFGHQPPGVWDSDRAQLGIGQSKIAVTPLQMALIASLVANKGWEPEPRLVHEVEAPDGSISYRSQAKRRLQIELPATFWDTLWSAMEGVITEGTGKTAKLDNAVWAGKTGTAEERKDHAPNAWFIAFGPIPNPEIAVCVMIEEGGHGGVTAAPIAAAWMKAYLAAKNGKAPALPNEPAVEMASESEHPNDVHQG